jgi:flagellar biosynthesis/type III secretory pathway M-ring protein FliF/YscJ
MKDRDSDSGSSPDRDSDEQSEFRQKVESELDERRQELDKRLAGPLERLARIAKRSPERL